MEFYVFHSTYKYDEQQLAVFYTEEEVLKLLNTHAQNPDFTFRVIQGVEKKYRPVEVVKRYVPAELTGATAR